MIGIDEVGRGAWAGPLLMVAARVKAHHTLPDDLADSKLLSKKQRELAYQQLLIVCDFGEGWVEADEIDTSGLGPALTLAAMRAVAALGATENEEICIDGPFNFLKGYSPKAYAKVKADVYEPIVSAASIYAKVVRDNTMMRLHYRMPQYGFDTNAGYGTLAHSQALFAHGITIHHRKSFKPIKQLLR
jgi:ribonuclease HII